MSTLNVCRWLLFDLFIGVEKKSYYTHENMKVQTVHFFRHQQTRAASLMLTQCRSTAYDAGRVESQTWYNKRIYLSKSHEVKCIIMFLALFDKNHIFYYLTFILTYWHWRCHWIMNIMEVMNVLVTNTRKSHLYLLKNDILPWLWISPPSPTAILHFWHCLNGILSKEFPN